MKVISHNCPTCSAGLTYDIDTQNWMCDFCKKSFNLEQLMDHHKKHDANKTSVLSGYFCENCGADIVTCDDNISSVCLYCSSPVIIKERIEGEYKPDLISPFKHNKEDIIKRFIKLKEERGLVPKNFFDVKNISCVHGVYIPLFVVTCEVSATIRGDGYVNSDYRSSFIRKGTMQFKDVPADAQSNIDDRYISALEPFEYDKFEPFEYPYLAGMSAEVFDYTKEEVYEQQIMKKIEEAAYDKVLNYGKNYLKYDIISKELKTFCSEFKHALIPIWCIHVQYHGKEYIFYVNDQNLKIVGTYPVDASKEALFFLLSLITNIVLIAFGFSFSMIVSVLITIIGTILVWYIYSNIISSYKTLRPGVKNNKYISEGSFIPIVSSDSDYRIR